MLKLVRVDYRLLHGQVAYVWFGNVKADSILIASDAVAIDESRKKILRMAKPSDCKLVIKSIQEAADILNSDVTASYNLIVLIESINDLYRLCITCPSIKSANLGLSAKSAKSRAIANSVYLNDEEIGLLKDLMAREVEIEVRQAPSDPVVSLRSLI